MKKRVFVLACLAMLPALAFGLSKTDQKKDADANGSISQAEYVAFAKSQAEAKGREFDEARVSKNFSKFDSNGDGSLDETELAAAAAKKKKNKKKRAGKDAGAQE